MTRQTTVALLAAVIAGVVTPTVVTASDKTCRTGNDPVVHNDAGQIAALETAIDEACPCVSDGGGRGAMRLDYLRCVNDRVKGAVRAGTLRSQCALRIDSAYRRSTCGLPTARDAVPCLERSSRGALRCRIMRAADCHDRPGLSRIACGDYQRCVDAGDTNQDYRVNRSDSGACVLPPTATPTQAATATRTAADTTTATATATQTPTATASETATPEPTSTPTETPTATPVWTATATATCGMAPPIVAVVVNQNTDTEEHTLLPPQANGICPTNTPSGGGCPLLNSLDGSAEIINVFDARDSVDPRACGMDPAALSYHWEILFPPTLQGAVYTSNGISGYLTPVLTIQPSSLPSLDDTDAGTDTFWRARLTVTSLTPPITQRIVYFRFKYRSSELTLQMSTDCQAIGHIDGVLCTLPAVNGLPTNEPH